MSNLRKILIMLRWVGLCFFVLFFCVHASGIEVVTSYSLFHLPVNKGQSYSPYIEVYWQINPRSIQYTKTEAGLWTSKIKTHVLFRNEKDVVIKEDEYILQTTPVDSLVVSSQSIIDLQKYVLTPGTIRMSIELSEVTNPGNAHSFTDSIVVAPLIDTAWYSSLQLLDTVYSSQEKSIFLKNKQQQVPLCINFLDDNRPTLRYYAELYNSNTLSKEQFPLTQTVFISKTTQERTIYGLEKKDTITASFLHPFSGSFDIAVLPSGNYNLVSVLKNSSGEVLASSVLFFQRSNKKPVKKEIATDTTGTPVAEKVEIFDLTSTFAGKFGLPQLKAIMKMLLPIATPLERNTIVDFLKKPEETYMRYFVYNFFVNRNEKNPKKEWLNYVDKVREVKNLFGSPSIPGYETDRGITWLKYGKPNERIIVQNEQGVLPYEVWQYNAPGKQSAPGAFLFYRPGFMVNDYRLLHSTVNGEVRNLNWRSSLYVSGSSGNYANTRAEQYIGNK